MRGRTFTIRLPYVLFTKREVIEKIWKGPLPTLLSSAVLGLFPLVNQAALRDTRWMIEHERELSGPVVSFLRSEALASQESALPEAEQFTVEEQAKVDRAFHEEWLVTHADPCQSAAVREARSSRALVVHGPPGTGKSQTIANIIGDFRWILAEPAPALTFVETLVALRVSMPVAPRIEDRLRLGESASMLRVQAAVIVVIFAAWQKLCDGGASVFRQC